MLLLICYRDGEFGTEEFAKPATDTFIFVDYDGNVISLSVELGGFLENFQRAKLNTYIASLAQILIYLYQPESSFVRVEASLKLLRSNCDQIHIQQQLLPKEVS
jgi:hypothetical protein